MYPRQEKAGFCYEVFFMKLWELKKIILFGSQVDGTRERLSEQQYNRLVDYITKTSCHLAPSCSFVQTPCPVVAVEPLPSTVKTYHYMVDPPFAQVFISKFTMVKNKALRKGFLEPPLRH